MKARTLLAAAAALSVTAVGVTTLGVAAPAFAAAPDATANCFQSQQWQDWRAPDSKTIYVRVHNKDIWRIDLSGGSNLLTDPANHLIDNLQDSQWICRPTDLSNLKVSDGRVVEPLFVKAITKLTPEQAAAIPQKDRP